MSLQSAIPEKFAPRAEELSLVARRHSTERDFAPAPVRRGSMIRKAPLAGFFWSMAFAAARGLDEAFRGTGT